LRLEEFKVGGLLGEAPRVLIGTIFYGKHKIVTDERTGQFDHAIAEEIIKKQEEFSDKTGNPCMIDVVGTTYEALIKISRFHRRYLKFSFSNGWDYTRC